MINNNQTKIIINNNNTIYYGFNMLLQYNNNIKLIYIMCIVYIRETIIVVEIDSLNV